MKLQVALDVTTLDEARAVLHDVVEYIDIVEVGLLFYTHGYDALTTLKAEFPEAEYLADVKISDGGYFCVKQAHEFGARYVTVLGVVDDETIRGAVEAQKETGISVVVDMVGCQNFYERVLQLDAMGVGYINIHTPVDLQQRGISPFDQLSIAKQLVKNAKLAVAGGYQTSDDPPGPSTSARTSSSRAEHSLTRPLRRDNAHHPQRSEGTDMRDYRSRSLPVSAALATVAEESPRQPDVASSMRHHEFS
ncbi:MAG: orotidine 5'-phosphate decarboxylase [Propionibacteriaceae bacterium]|nr:orotidine 5'-phosphate decarboxylase [Propionibacteriaceae bacterium]